MSLLTFENVTLGYEGRAVISELNFTVEKGDFVCILGQNGSGKTTTMKALLGLLDPLSGRIEKNFPKNAMGYLPQQQPSQKDFPASVREVVLSGCQGRRSFIPFYTKDDKAIAEENMERMNIRDIASCSFRELSGGQKQRVLLARSLCAARELLLLDEPTTGLDYEVTEELYELVREINREQDITVMMISHDPGRCVNIASHILHLDHRMLYFGKSCDYDAGRFVKGGTA